MDEGERKELTLSAYKLVRGEIDLRPHRSSDLTLE